MSACSPSIPVGSELSRLVSSPGAEGTREWEKLVRAGEAIGGACPKWAALPGAGVREAGQEFKGGADRSQERFSCTKVGHSERKACRCLIKPVSVCRFVRPSIGHWPGRQAAHSDVRTGPAGCLAPTRGSLGGKPWFPTAAGSLGTYSSAPWAWVTPRLPGPASISPGRTRQPPCPTWPQADVACVRLHPEA